MIDFEGIKTPLEKMEEFEKHTLNRAERKRLKKYGDINGIKPIMTFEKYVYYFNLALADALFCETNMNAEQIREVFKKANTTFECMESGNLNADDLQKMCLEELGINFVRTCTKNDIYKT